MNVKPNIGILNALIRITAGLTILAWCTAKLVKRPWRESYLLVAICGAMKVAEGIVRYCPLTAMYEKCPVMEPLKKCGSTAGGSSEYSSMDGMEGLNDEVEAHNPT
ncbi:YgaP family membrane protein [Neobacillus mesonae]|uniref:DUF2892 domain-containing protein n=1 Tax=Neobacillus mesonae TaxID=1193713 RepID=A0A3T0HSX2_9BACI|nr:DUF2892 domain-containing protein [Neobacillus mesonae]AZU60214.1 DUF2892 domain-containing protein [Neobacillus mesonae]MED4206250.1 DUF2892 domain-containing protein [Neobacillus mesonae]